MTAETVPDADIAFVLWGEVVDYVPAVYEVLQQCHGYTGEDLGAFFLRLVVIDYPWDRTYWLVGAEKLQSTDVLMARDALRAPISKRMPAGIIWRFMRAWVIRPVTEWMRPYERSLVVGGRGCVRSSKMHC